MCNENNCLRLESVCYICNQQMLHVILVKLNIVPTFIIEWEPFSCCLFWLLPPPTSDFPLTKYTLSHVVIRILSICPPFGWAIEILEWCFSCAPVKLSNAMLIFVWWHLTLSLPVETKIEFLLTISIQSQVDNWWEYRKKSIRDYHLTQFIK